MVSRHQIIYKQRIKLDSYFTPYTKINSQCFKDLNITLEIGTNKKNVGENSMTLFYTKIF